jgi:glyoxylase-like metal-dependent hydrolase (beta-lactamase superfamily II)
MTDSLDGVRLDYTAGVIPSGYRVYGSVATRRKSITLRQLSPRVLWVDVFGYQATVLIGANSAMLIDPLDVTRAHAIVELMRREFSVEISCIAYSHWHGDHIRGANSVLESTRWREPLSIVATEVCASEVRVRGIYPLPTIELRVGDSFDFEGIELRFSNVGGHTVDSTLINVVADGVAHCVDLVHPLQAEFFSFGAALGFGDYVRALEKLSEQKWTVLTAGHGDIGWPSDVQLALEYCAGLKRVTAEAVREVQSAPERATGDSPMAAAADLRKRVIASAVPKIERVWSARLPGLKFAVESHVLSVLDDILYFD